MTKTPQAAKQLRETLRLATIPAVESAFAWWLYARHDGLFSLAALTAIATWVAIGVMGFWTWRMWRLEIEIAESEATR